MAKSTKIHQQKMTLFQSIVTPVISIVLIILGLLIYHEAYNSKIIPGVRVLGINMGGKTKSQAQKILDGYVKQELEKPIVILVHAQPKIISPSEVEMQIDTKATLEKAYSVGRQGNIAKQLTQLTIAFLPSYNIAPQIKFNEDKLQEKLNTLASDALLPVQNAGLKYEGGDFKVTPSRGGTQVDKNVFKKEIIQKIRKQKAKTANLPLKGKKPDILEEQTLEAKEAALKIISKPVVLNFESQTFEADKDEIASWIEFKEDVGKLSAKLSDDKINQLLDQIAKKTDQKVINKEVVEGTGQVLKEGKSGRALDRTKALKDIQEAVQKDNRQIALFVNEVQPQEKKIKLASGAELGKFDSLYIDINLSSQVLTLINGEQVISSYKVSTGKWSTPTPIGIRYVQDKNPYAYSSQYGLYMPFWMGIGGGYGIHELPEWPGGAKEGESHLGTPVSHGCIRLGVGPAETVYSTVGIGTPVNIHK